jgi:hypothetical protein
MITVDNDYTPPTDRKKTGPKPTYPLRTMTPGQSFFVAGDRAVIRVCAAIANKNMGDLFTVRTATENGILGARCYRLQSGEVK